MIEKSKLKIGDIIYIDIKSIQSQGITEKKSNVEYDEYYFSICRSCGVTVKKYIDDNILDDDFLIAIRYIGNGVFEEINSHEKLIWYVSGPIYVENDKNKVVFKYLDEDLEFSKMPYSMPLCYKDYLMENEIEDNLENREVFVNCLNNFSTIASKYPLSVGFLYDPVDKKDIADKYLKHSSNERLEIISKIKKLAQVDTAILQENIEKSKKLLELNSNKKLKIKKKFFSRFFQN